MTTHSQDFSPNKQALLKIRELKQQLADAQTRGGEPIAIVSMACRFPRQSRTPEAFWKCLLDQTDEVTEIPDDRWDLDAFHHDDPDVPGKMYARRGVFLDDLDQMDPEFFGISPREATWVDPQQRLLMEVGWEALERAGWTPEKIGQRTGVFVGWMHNDYQNEASDSFLNLNPYIATGAAGSFLCGRLAYYLGLEGPSVAVDTACSSSLVALHLAIQSLQREDCDRAMVGGVNAICSPTTNILTCKLKALSPSGQSRAFDAAADGYLRGEGCGVVTLRRLSEAEQDGDPILGIIRGSAVGHNGFSTGLTAPNPKAQTKVIREALRRANIQPQQVDYLEAHGTGTELGDPIEIQAAAAALSEDRTPEHPLLVGSVKTNIGHLEAAAGMAGLIKVLLAMQHDQIPGQLNFETPNPHIPWDKIPVKVLTEVTRWPHADRKIAGVSAFGMSGTNAHVVIEAPQLKTGQSHTRSASPIANQTHDARGFKDTTAAEPQLIVLSGKTKPAVESLADAYGRHIAADPSLRLSDIAFTTSVGRTQFEHRTAIVASDRKDMLHDLKTLARGGVSDSVVSGSGRRAPKVAWQFTGQGSQYAGMARGLYQSQPVFRRAIDQCDVQLKQWRTGSLKSVLFADESLIDHTAWTQPAIFAVQMGLAHLLQHWGLQPDVVLGHSVGQYAAACVAGIMSWDDGLHLIGERGRLIGELPSGGTMLAVFAPLENVEGVLEENSRVSLAAINGTHMVVSGPESDIERIQVQFAEQGIRSKALTTSHAFHSALMDPVLRPFQAVADTIAYDQASIPLICNVTGNLIPAEQQLTGKYWAEHIRNAVRYSDSVATVEEMGCEIILELGPQAILTRMAAANWNRPTGSLISCLEKDGEDAESILKAIGGLFVQGCSPDFETFYRGQDRQRILLPTYPFQRRRFWGPDKPRAFHAQYHTAHPLLGSPVSLAGVKQETRYESFIEPDSPPWLPDHEVMGNIVLPGAAFVEMAIAAAGSDEIVDLVFEQPLRPTGRTALQTVVVAGDDGRKTIETYSSVADGNQWTRNFTANIVTQTPGKRPQAIDRTLLESSCSQSAAPADFYQRMIELGLTYGPKFQTIHSLQYSTTEVLTQLKTDGDVRGFNISPTLLDGALHSLAVGLLADEEPQLFLPVGIGRVRCHQAVENEVWCHARWTQNEGSIRTADLVLFAESGQVLCEIEGLKVQQISVQALRRMSGTDAERLVYELQWKSHRLPASRTSNKSWLLVGSEAESGIINRVAESLSEQGHAVAIVRLVEGQTFSGAPGAPFSMCGTSLDNWQKLFDHLSIDDTTFFPEGIAWCFGQSDQELGRLDATTKTNCSGLMNLIATLTERGQRRIECGLQLITTDAIDVNGKTAVDCQQTQFWGLGRVIGAEQPEFRCRLIDVASTEQDHEDTVNALIEILVTETRDNQLAIREGQFHVPRIKPAKVKSGGENQLIVNPEGSYLITGGLGKLGRQAAKWLADQGATQIVLVSRRTPDESTQSFLDSISSNGCEIVRHAADISSRADVEEMMGRFGNDLRSLSGIIHTAGVLDDALLGDQSWERFEKVLAPKVVGASLLHAFTQTRKLDFFVLYSSAAAVLGSPGQSNYATANGFLDGLAWHRRSLGLPATSINWGPWTEGMADDERIVKRLALQGIRPLTIEDAHRSIDSILRADLVQATVMDVEWRRMRQGLGGEAPAMLDEIAPARQKSRMGDSEFVAQLKRLRGNTQRELLITTIQQSLQRVLSTPDAPETDRPLIEMGLDSLMAVEFGTELQQMLGDEFTIGPTMLFDHPTIDAIADHVLNLVVSGSEVEPPSEEDVDQPVDSVNPSLLPARDDVAIIGMSCRFPGAHDVQEFWQNLIDGIDSVRPIPEDRWDVDHFYDVDREPGKMYTREGGFLEDIADFDAEFFNISGQEACWIDPQHRMLLENSYRALEDAGIPTQPLRESNVGVFMGIMGQDYAFIPSLDDVDVIKGFQGAGLSHSAGVGRISYVFGFEGPSVAVDTASSSSLVALLQAVRSLQDGNCNLALAGGVNAILAPVNSLLMSKAGLLSPDGRCKSFSAAADGFGRGEGCGVVVLKRLSDAQREGDRILAVVRGGAVVHNGFSSGITAPSSKSQARVIAEALKDARLAPSQVQYLEAHGTGTEYGDPMELGAAASVYGKGRKPDQPLLVGSVKANISHLEAAGGVSGLIKTVLALQHGVIPPQAHFAEPSPHIPWQRLPIKMVTEATHWPDSEIRTAGVTALGLVGTNAHVVLSSAPDEMQRDLNPNASSAGAFEHRSSELLVLSARNEMALNQMLRNYREFIASRPDVNLADICHTAAVGRRHFEHRVAMVLNSSSHALESMDALVGEPQIIHTEENPSQFESENGSPTNGSPTNGSPINGQLSDSQPEPGGATNQQSASTSLRLAEDRGQSGVFENVVGRPPKIGWVFTGDIDCDMNSARQLYSTEPAFREFILELDQRFSEHASTTGGIDPGLKQWLTGPASEQLDMNDVHLFAFQAGLAKIWSDWGILPDVVVGTGVGQFTASCIAGGLCFKDAAVLVAEREKVISELGGELRHPKSSGLDEALLSEQAKAVLDHFESIADGFNYYPPNLPLICSISGDEVPVHRSLGGSYWREHLLAATSLERIKQTMGNMHCDYLLKIGPAVDPHADDTTDFSAGSATRIDSLLSDKGVSEALLQALGRFYVAGINPDFERFFRYRNGHRIRLPSYPFQKQRYWITEISRHLHEGAETVNS